MLGNGGIRVVKQVFSIIVKNWIYYFVWIIISVLLPVFGEISGSSSSNIASFFPTIYLAMWVQISIIRETTFEFSAKPEFYKGFFGYSLKFITLAIIAVGLSLPAFLWFAAVFNGLTVGWLMVSTTALVVIYAALMSLVGTWPTSNIMGIRTSLKAAWARGAPNFLTTFVHLAVSLVAMSTMSFVIGAIGTAAFGTMLMPAGVPNIPLILVAMVALSINAVGITYGAAVLANVYMRHEVDEPPLAVSPVNA